MISNALKSSSRPLFVWGAGMRPYRDQALALARSLGIPIATTWGSIDLINHDDKLHTGCFGTHGVRTGNLAVQNCDLLISLGCRLDTKATGTPSDFAPKAKIVMVDIDQNEIDKMPKVGRTVDGFCMDVGEFIGQFGAVCQDRFDATLGTAWHYQIWKWKSQYVPKGPAYDLMRRIGEHTTAQDTIVSDTGNTLGWIMQGYPFKGERFIHATNFTPMGYGLGGAIGAAFATGNRVVCIVGDGGALMSVQELATIARHNLNIKIILLNNKGHGMCRFTQRQWLGGTYPATSIEGGLGFPDWRKTAEAFGIQNVYAFDEWISADRPQFMEVMIDPDETLAFQVKYGEPLA